MKYIEYDSSFGEEEKKQAKTLKVACNLNNAACKMKLKDYKEAEKLCTKVLYCLPSFGGQQPCSQKITTFYVDR